MRYCVSARQSTPILQLADEIMMEHKDRNLFFDYEDKNLLNKDIIIHIPTDEEIDWDMLKIMKNKMKSVTLCFDSIMKFTAAREQGFDYYWHFPAVNYYDINGLLELGVSQIFLDGFLTFDLKNITKMVHDVKLRMVCNSAYASYIWHRNGIRGSYVRPEDIPVYEPYIYAMEFSSDTLTQEATTLKIYKEDKAWPGNLNLLIKNLNIDIDNRAIPEDFAKARICCKQKCQSGIQCNLCESIFNYVNTLDRHRFDWDTLLKGNLFD